MLKYTDVELTQEIKKEIDTVRARGDELIDPVHVTLKVCKKHRKALDNDDDNVHVAFFLYTSYTTVRKYATRCINALDPDTKDDDTGPSPTPAWLPGFEVRLLQAVYVIYRDGVQVGVPVELMTDAELEAKAAHYRAMARQEVAHAAELLRYRDWRREQQTDDPTSSPTQPQAGV